MNQDKSINPWYTVQNIETVDSPALLLYKSRIEENIRLAKEIIGDIRFLRPHVKTNKIAEVCRMMLAAGITHFKCATIAEAEMLASIGAPDILLAYQPVGPKVNRLLNLIKAFPRIQFACLVDNTGHAEALNKAAAADHITLSLFIDLNIGMNRTGIIPEKALPLVDSIHSLNNLKLKGLHGYDGHIHDTDLSIRQQKSDEGFNRVTRLLQKIEHKYNIQPEVVMGGTPPFPLHARRKNVQCSPGTFVFNDWGYKNSLPDQPFEYAALVLTRVISIIDEHTICTDLGHKAVAAENPLPRVHFLNAPNAKPTGQSEEHLVLQVPDSSAWRLGDVLYGVPVHICPTVALYDQANIVEEGMVTTQWDVIARKRFIHF